VSANHSLPQQRTACLRSFSLLVFDEISNEGRGCNIMLAGEECGSPHEQIWMIYDNNLPMISRKNCSTSRKTGPNTNLPNRISYNLYSNNCTTINDALVQKCT
jgi:hypothetical protein